MESAPQEHPESNPEVNDYIYAAGHYRYHSEDAAISYALANGMKARVLKRDENNLGETDDYDLKRVNFTVTDGIVTSVRLG